MRRARIASVLAVTMSIAVAACASEPGPTPAPTNNVASETDVPTPTPTASPSAPPTPTIAPVATPTATPGTEPSATPAVIDPVGRTSMDLAVTYDVKAAVSVDSGALEVTTLLRIRNDSGGGIDHLELNTIAARLGGLRIIEATVDDEPVKVRIDDQTLNVPLERILAAGESTEVRIGYRARLRTGFSGSDWMFTHGGGMIVLYRWIPWVSRALPFDRPNDGQPFVTPSASEVDVEIVTDLPMVLAGPAADVIRAGVGSGGAWAFTMNNVRDVAVVLAPDFKVVEGKASGVTIRVYAPSSSANRDRLLSLARQAVTGQTALLGRDFPRSFLAVVETEGGEAAEAPGLIMVPRTKDTLNRTYLVHQKVAHAWFYDMVGNDQRADPFADEGPADFLARTVLHSFRDSRCSASPLDRGLGAYSANCYYEIVQVQGGLLLEDVRNRIGNARFWEALRTYLGAHQRGLGSTRELLETFRAAADVNLLPLFRARFPSTY